MRIEPRKTRVLAALLACLHVGSLVGTAAAQAPTPPPPASKRIATLDLVPVGVTDAEARRVTEVLRRAVGRNMRYRLAPAPLRLRPMLLALGCPRLDVACLSKIGKQLGVDQVLFGELVRQGAVDKLTLNIFSVAGQKVVRAQEREITDAPGSEGYAAALDDTTQMALGETLSLSLESNVEGAIVLVNGQPVGTTPYSGGEALRPGTNDIIVRMRGHDDYKQKVVVRPGKPVTLRAEMKKIDVGPAIVIAPPDQKEPDKKEPDKKKEGEKGAPVYKKWWFWTIIGAVVVGGTAGAIAATRGGGASDRAPTVGVEF